jgi:hypothetical protein
MFTNPYVPLSAGLWFSAPNGVNLNFLVNPACLPSATTCTSTPTLGNNFFSPAPVAGENFDIKDLHGNPIVPSTPGTLAAATPPPGFDTSTVQQVNFTANPTLQDGQYILEWTAFDNVNILEQNQTLVAASTLIPPTHCPDGTSVPTGGFCYVTSLFSAPLNIDSTPPVIASTNDGQTYTANSKVPAAFTCIDPTPGAGTASCTSNLGGANLDTKPTGGLTTNKTFMVTGTDKAIPANSATSTFNYVVSCNYAALTLPSTAKRGTFIQVKASVIDCKTASQTVKVAFTLSGPLGKNCSHSSTVIFTTPSFTIKSGTSFAIAFPLFIASNACTTQPYSLTTTTVQNGIAIDTVTSTLTVTN